MLSKSHLLKDSCVSSAQGQLGLEQSFVVNNPYDNSQLARVANFTNEQVLAAIENAQLAAKDWQQQTAAKRAAVLNDWADLIERHLLELATILTAEQGKPIKEAIAELRYANSFVRFFAAEAERVYGDIIPAKAKNLRYLVLKQPVGLCAAITPWNFPAAMVTRKLAPALAAGCPVLLKPAAQTPLSALALAKLAKQAGMPVNLLQVITGDAARIGLLLCQSPSVKKISFTGSTAVGRVLMSQSSSSLKRLSLELGGNAPFIVFADADIDSAVQGLLVAKFRNAGQTCIAANRVYLQREIATEFIDKFSAAVAKLKLGDGSQENVDIGPLINMAALNKAQRLVADAVEQGAKCIVGGKAKTDGSLLFEPTIVTAVKHSMQLVHTEIFAPVVPIMTFDSTTEVLKLANDTEYGLAAYFYSNNHTTSWQVSEQLQFGMIGHNTGFISNELAPFGGIKQSGFGSEGSKYGIDEYLNLKYWCSGI